MVVSKRDLANTYFPLNLSLLSNPPAYNNINIDIEINIPKGWSNISSTKNSRKLLVNSSTLSVLYAERMLAFNNSSSWAEQVKHTEFQGLSLSYVSLKTEDTAKANKAIVIANTSESQEECVNSVDMNTCQLQGPETMFISHLVNQPNTD